jgi:hypothetical protein
MSTLHRRDISRDDLALLARFSKVIKSITPEHDLFSLGLIFLIGEVEVLLPVWYQASNGWMLSTYKPFKINVIGLETATFRKICRYLCIRESQLVNCLYNLSMLAVVRGQKHYEPPRFRMKFMGEMRGYEGLCPPAVGFGFVIERRRAEGAFK